MKTFLKYFIGLFLIATFSTFYLLKTDIGKEEIRVLIENHLSKNNNNEIKIDSLNLKNFPQITIKLTINQTANMVLIGSINQNKMKMHYHLTGDSFTFNELKIQDKIDLQGEAEGYFNALKIKGQGEIFEGVVDYNFTALPKSIENMNITMKEVNSSKLLDFFEFKPMLHGLANIHARFTKFSTYQKQGHAEIRMKQVRIPLIEKTILFQLDSNIIFKNIEYDYHVKLDSKQGTIELKNGEYHQSRKTLKGEYNVHINNLGYFEKLLHHPFKGSLDTKGTLFYNENSKLLRIEGFTRKFEGKIDYVFKNNNLDFKLSAVSLQKVLEQFSQASLVSSKVYGTINYNLEEQIAIINTDLRETYFLKSQFSTMIQEKLKTNILTDAFNKSSFSGGYKDSVLFSVLKIDNGINYLYLTDTKLNLLTTNIDSKFEILMTGTKIQGKIYDKLANPQIKINTKMFTIYNKHLDNWLQGL